MDSWLPGQLGVLSACVNAPTGSLLITYDPLRTDAGELLAAIAAYTGLAIAEPEPGQPPAQRIFDAARSFDEVVLEASDGRWGLRLAVPVAMGIASVASLLFSAHRRAPRWDNLLFWGFQLFCSLNGERDARQRPREWSRDGRRHSNGG
jgi:hypothetical protein